MVRFLTRDFNMSSRLGSVFNFFLSVEKHERLKVFLLTLSFFFVIGGYTVVKELKDSIFSSIVGSGHVKDAKVISMFILIPAILLYSKLVDTIAKQQLVYFYTILYSIAGFIFAYFLGHPTIGLANTVASSDRYFGWLFYFFMEGYSPFVVSLFWAFANSITTPESAKNNYSLMIAGSKIGGMVSTGFAWWLLTRHGNFYGYALTDVVSHQILLSYASACLLVVPFVISILTRKVSSKELHGYEAAYKEDKKEETESPSSKHTGIFGGLIMLFRQPYMLGIFATVLFYEIVNVLLQLKRLEIFDKESSSIKEFSASLYEQRFQVHIVGLLITLIGTRAMIKLFGERICLLLIPLLTGSLVFYFLLTGSRESIMFAFIMLGGIHYAFSSPLKESLYIPTVKEMRFKTKSWIEAFGGKFSKACGSLYKHFSGHFGSNVLTADLTFFGILITLWVIVSYLLGKTYEYAIKHNKVIGASK